MIRGRRGCIALALMPMPAWAADEASLDYLLLLITLLLGVVVTMAAYKFARPSWSAKRTVDQDTLRLATVLDSANICGYTLSLSTHEEWFSPCLLALLEKNARTARFQDFESLLDELSWQLLNRAVADLKAGSEDFRLELKTVAGATLECDGHLKRDGNGPTLVLWWLDVTDRQAELQRLRKESGGVKYELQQMNNMLNLLPIPIWQRNQDLAIKFCNLAYMEACEEVPETAGLEALEITSNGKALARKALTSQETERERRHMVLQGERRLYDFVEIPWQNKHTLSGYALDISELETVQDELERNRSAQTDLLESTNSAIAIYGKNQRLEYFNNAFVALWKLDEQWLRTKPLYGDVLERQREDRTLPEQANFPLFKQERLKLFTNLLEPQEEFFYLPDGRTLRVLAIPHTLGGILFAYEDVTDRLALERSYNTLIAVQKETLDNLHEGVVVYGEDGRLKLSNPTYMRMWNLDSETVKSEPHVGDLLNRNKHHYYFTDWEHFRDQFIAKLSTREVVQERLERRDGKVFEILIVPLPDGQTLMNYVDITDSALLERSLREKNEALEEADRLKSEFLANVSYELRSPLTTISGYSEMLGLGYFGELQAKQQEYVGTIYEASKHLMHLINDILDIASIEAGYMQLEFQRFDIRQMLDSVQTLVGDRSRKMGVPVSIQCHPRIGAMLGDENRIRQAIFNLVTNAIKYSDRRAPVLVGAEAAKEEGSEIIRFWVQDQGIGISEDEQEAVFSKFYRGTAARSRQSGTGLGLSMVKSFIELHGGRIELQSTPGKGTTISCILPRENVALMEAATPVAQ